MHNRVAWTLGKYAKEAIQAVPLGLCFRAHSSEQKYSVSPPITRFTASCSLTYTPHTGSRCSFPPISG